MSKKKEYTYTQKQLEQCMAWAKAEGALEEYKFWIPLSCERLPEDYQGVKFGYKLKREFVQSRRKFLEESREAIYEEELNKKGK